jgi:DNA-directed RNA polymerase subunit RPC12/RpoP
MVLSDKKYHHCRTCHKILIHEVRGEDLICPYCGLSSTAQSMTLMKAYCPKCRAETELFSNNLENRCEVCKTIVEWDINVLISQHFNSYRSILNYFKCPESWQLFPLEDHRDMYWALRRGVFDDSNIMWSPEPITEELLSSGRDYYTAEIYKTVHLPGSTFEGPEFTMILVDTNTDGNILLMIFDNKKKQAWIEE